MPSPLAWRSFGCDHVWVYSQIGGLKQLFTAMPSSVIMVGPLIMDFGVPAQEGWANWVTMAKVAEIQCGSAQPSREPKGLFILSSNRLQQLPLLLDSGSQPQFTTRLGDEKIEIGSSNGLCSWGFRQFWWFSRLPLLGSMELLNILKPATADFLTSSTLIWIRRGPQCGFGGSWLIRACLSTTNAQDFCLGTEFTILAYRFAIRGEYACLTKILTFGIFYSSCWFF